MFSWDCPLSRQRMNQQIMVLLWDGVKDCIYFIGRWYFHPLKKLCENRHVLANHF